MVKWLILCGNEDNWDVAIKQKVWGVKANLSRLWNEVLREDVVFFYVTRTVKRLIGVARVKEKLDPRIYPPKPLWPDEIREGRVIYSYRFKFEPIHVCKNPMFEGIDTEGLRVSKQKGMSRIIDQRSINELSRRVKLNWHVDVSTPKGVVAWLPTEERKVRVAPITKIFFPLDSTISERDLQKYIEKHSEVIEPGLRLVEKSYRTSTRNVIDFLFRNAKNDYVILETKTRVDRSVFGQVGEYIADIRRERAEKEGVGVRAVILSTAVDDKVIHAAKEFGLTAIVCRLVGRKIICPKCGVGGRQGDIYCGRCGTELLYPKLICSSCGLENMEGDVYCRRCRTKLI